MQRIVLKYGLRAGVLMAILSWLSYFVTKGMTYTLAQIASVLVIAIALIPIFQAMRSWRSLGKRITFWQSFFTGALTTVVAGIIMALSTIIWAFTSLSTSYTDESTVMMQPVEQGVIMFLLVLLIGSVMSLIGAIVVRG